MSRVERPTPRPKPKQKRKPEPKPLLPQHRFPEPYARLLILGDQDAIPIYEDVAAEILLEDLAEGVETLQRIALDEDWYDYLDEAFPSFEDPRTWSPVHAIRVLEKLGPNALAAVEPLLVLLDDDDDALREEMPFFFAAVGAAAIPPLCALLVDQSEDTYVRAGAGESLAEMGERYPELRSEVLSILEQTLVNETEDATLTGFVVCNLLDLGAKESMPLIELAYQERRVDLTVVQLPDVQEHFGLPITAPYLSLRDLEEGWDPEEDDEELAEPEENGDPLAEAAEEPVQAPYVAAPKVGRNEPCPCGSGKKYKKCCGAA